MFNYKKISFQDVQRSFNLVQNELEEVGLYVDYLDQIELHQSPIPSLSGELGYVYDSGLSWQAEILGYEEGVIYIPSMAPIQLYVPGGTLVDTIRHEYAHAWAWLDPDLIAGSWFKNTFGLEYDEEDDLGADLYRVFNNYESYGFEQSPYWNDYVSAYALSSPSEDFAETFMFYLRYRKSLKRFKGREGVWGKLNSISNILRSR